MWIVQSSFEIIGPSWFYSWKYKPSQLRCHTFKQEFSALIKILHLFDAQFVEHKFVILTDHTPLLNFMQQTLDSQKLRRWQEFCIRFDYTMEGTAGKNSYCVDALSRTYNYQGVSSTEDDSILDIVDSNIIRPLQEIISKHIKLSDYLATFASTWDNSCYYMPSSRSFKCTHVQYDYNNWRGQANTGRPYKSCLHLAKKDI